MDETDTSSSHDPDRDAVESLSPRQILIDWANQQDGWVRRLVSEVLATGRAVPEGTITEIYESFKAEKGLGAAMPDPVAPITAAGEGSDDEESLILTKLSQVKGVNALAEGHEISFNPNMTVLFGENGAGKTGYARVLKCAAGVRTAEDILPNAHATTHTASPSARIEFRLGETDDAVAWNNERGLAPFTRISVFDAPAVLLHVDSDLGYVYTPADLALFKHCSDAIRAISDLALAEVRAKQPSGNPFIARFVRGTAIYALIESLSPATSLDELRKAAGSSGEDSAKRREVLTGEIAALKGNTIDEKLYAAQTRKRSLGELLSLSRSAASFNGGAYETARLALEAISSEYRRVRTELFEPHELAGEADDEWQAFVGAADTYRFHLGLDDYPHEGDKCLYCRQTLDEASQDAIRRYQRFLDDSLARQITDARSRLDSTLPQYTSAELSNAGVVLTGLLELDPKPAWLDDASKLVVEAGRLLSLAADRGAFDGSNLPELATALSASIDAAEQAETASIEELEQQRANRASALEVREKELATLIAQEELRRQMPAIEAMIADAQFAQKLDTVTKRISNSTLRSLTEASKTASEELVNQNFEKLFEEECKLLRAPSVQLQFQGRSGRAERTKAVARHRPSAVLSEGEVKCLAIADFLAECRLRGACAPMVFDDPVTSLDYRRLKEVAERLVLLSKSHQVVVFTHNIWLTTELLSQFDGNKEQCSYYTIRDQDDVKGLVSAEAGPRQDTPAQIGKRINDLLNTGKAADPTVQEAVAEKGYELLRSWCEAFVEQELLEKVTQRYQPNVMMTRLSSIKADFIPSAVAVIEPLFEKACRYMGGHSQPLEQLSIRPSVTELEADWKQLQAVRDAYRKASS